MVRLALPDPLDLRVLLALLAHRDLLGLTD
jgi:hypothetical protein